MLRMREHTSPEFKQLTHYNLWQWISWGHSPGHQQATCISWLSLTISPSGLKPTPSPTKRQPQWQKKLTDEFSFSFPLEQLHANQGRNFESAVITEVCTLLGFVKTRTTPYHPQSDDLVETHNQTILSRLATAVLYRATI